MKKYLIPLILGMALLGLVGLAQASSYFTQGHLIRAIVDVSKNIEVLTDLGDVSTWTTPGSAPAGAFGPAFDLSAFGGDSWDKLTVGYFVYSVNGSLINAWTSGPLDGQTSGARKAGVFQSAASAVLNNYVGDSQTRVGIIEAGNPNGYYAQMNKNGTAPGSFAGLIPAGNGEISLAGLLSNSSVEQALYYYPNMTATMGATLGTLIASLHTVKIDGTHGQTVVGGSAVPIPASVFLLGSGLLGLLGVRSRIYS